MSNASYLPESAEHCCLCEELVSLDQMVIESRPTGESRSTQEWFYCQDCWLQMTELRKKEFNLQSLILKMGSV